MVNGEECLTAADFKFGDAVTSSRGLNLVGCGKGPTVITGWAANYMMKPSSSILWKHALSMRL